jgi:hypothetical protein
MSSATSEVGDRVERHPEPVAPPAQALPTVDSASAYLPAADPRALNMATGSSREQVYLKLQRERGNTFVQRMVAAETGSESDSAAPGEAFTSRAVPSARPASDTLIIQRQPPDAPPAPATPDPATAGTAVWQVPAVFGGAHIDNGADASATLIDIKNQLEPLKDQFEGIPAVFGAVEKLLHETYGAQAAGPLTPDLAQKLQALGLLCVGAYNVALSELKKKLAESMSFKEEKAGEMAEKAAEILNATAFGKEADNEALEHAKEGFEKIHVFIEWSHYTNEWVVTALKMAQAAEKFEKIAEALEKAGEWASKLSVAVAALNTGLAAYSAIKVSNDPGKSDTQKSVAELKAGFSAVPLITSLAVTVATLSSAATGIGLLWTTMAPLIDKALQMIERVDEMTQKFYKATNENDWWDEAHKQGGGSAPQIPSNMHLPGGQEALNFMWSVFRGQPPEEVPAIVTKLFYENRKKFNEGHEGGDELETEWHLFRDNEVKNLVPWVQRHREEVWGMLYGALPHP